MTKPTVTIVVLNWNGLENTKLCLESLWLVDYPNYDVLVIDNGSKDGSVEYLEKLQHERLSVVFLEENRGFTGGHIEALKHTKSDYVYLLNNDAVISSDLLTKAVEILESDEKIAVLGGKAYHWNDDNPAFSKTNSFYSYQEIDPISAEATTLTKDSKIKEVSNVSGSGVMIRRSVINTLGYFDNDFFAYYEETDLFARYKACGHKVMYSPDLEIWHKVGDSTKNKPEFYYYLIFKNQFIFAMKNIDGNNIRLFLLYYIKTNLIKPVFRYLTFNAGLVEKARLRAFFYNIFRFKRSLHKRRLVQKQKIRSYVDMIILEKSISLAILCSKSTLASDMESRTGLSYFYTSNKPPKTTINGYLIKKSPLVNISKEIIAILSADTKYILLGFSEMGLKQAYVDQIIATIKQGGSENTLFTNKYNEPMFFVVNRKMLVELLLTANSRKKASTFNSFSIFEFSKQHIGYKKKMLDIDIRADHHLKFGARRNLVRVFFAGIARLKIKTGNFLKRLWTNQPVVSLKVLLGNLLLLISGKESRAAIFKSYFVNPKKIKRVFWINFDKYKNLQKRSKGGVNYYDSNNFPVFINCRDRVDPLKKLIKRLEDFGAREIYLIDNNSSYPPLLSFYSRTKYQVIRLMGNEGHTAPWKTNIIPLIAKGRRYILSDPDVIPVGECPSDTLKRLSGLLSKYPWTNKVGLGLSIDDLPDHYHLKETVIQWESQFWKDQLEEGVYVADIDTTFALYREDTPYVLTDSLRTGFPYVARHEPWYQNSKSPTPEERYYREHASSAVNTWNKEDIPEHFKKVVQALE